MRPTKAARYLPQEFVESSQVGGLFTIAAYVLMLVCFSCELMAFLRSDTTSSLMLDPRGDENLQLNFDVDFYDIECRHLQVSVYAQGTREALSMAAKDFWLRSFDSNGKPFGMAIRPGDNDISPRRKRGPDDDEFEEREHERQMRELEEQDGKSELDSDWLSSHDGFKHKSFEHVIQGHDFVFINFFAEWCSHCRQFHPVWTSLAKVIHEDGKRMEPMTFPDQDDVLRTVRLVKVNCVDFKQLCHDKGIDAYPTLRMYKADGSFALYEGKREELALQRWIEKTVKMKSYKWGKKHDEFEHGCNAKGFFSVPRVPGHLEIMAGGGDQTLNPRLTNVSHRVNHLSFTDPGDGRYHRKSWVGLPNNMLNHVSPLDGTIWATKNYHEAYVHDFQVVGITSLRGYTAYQMSHNHRLSRLYEEVVPQAQFHWDMEPFSVVINSYEKRWYDFGTSTFAIIGGVYVVMRLCSQASKATVSKVTKAVGVEARNRQGHNVVQMD